MLNKNLNASLSSSFTPFWRNAFSVSKEQTCWHSYSNHYIPEKPLQRGTSKHAIIEAVSQRLGLNTRVKHHGNLRRNCTLLYNWLVWHVEHTFSRGTLFFFVFFFFWTKHLFLFKYLDKQNCTLSILLQTISVIQQVILNFTPMVFLKLLLLLIYLFISHTQTITIHYIYNSLQVTLSFTKKK